MRNLILIRNAETLDNAYSLLQGQAQGDLSEVGLRQAGRIGLALAGLAFDHVYSSPLQRALDTCLYAGIQAVPERIQALAERRFGILQGYHYSDALALPPDQRPPGGESLQDLALRAEGVLDHILEGPHRSVCVFAHHEIILALVFQALGLPLEYFRGFVLSNASITQLQHGPRGWVARRINDTSHLAELDTTKPLD